MISKIKNIALRYVQRRVLLLSLMPLALLFAVTATLARTYHAREEALVTEWFDRGNADLVNGKPGPAFEDFRNALSYGPENHLVQLRLSEALLADGRYSEARSYLQNLWEGSPGSGEVNLDLAHVSRQMGDADQAIRYFHSAIFGSWDGESAPPKRKVRLELCEFLLFQNRVKEARAEIAGLAADTPAEDGAMREENGRLFLRAGESSRALAEFEAALQSDAHRSQWLADAGQVAFEAGDYLKAETYLSGADRENPSEEIHASLLLVREVLGSDPFLAGLNDEEQTRRTWRDFSQGRDRLRQCGETLAAHSTSDELSSDLQSLNTEAEELKKRVTVRSLGMNPELRSGAMQFVFRIESAASQICGSPGGLDQALILIGKRHEGSNL